MDDPLFDPWGVEPEAPAPPEARPMPPADVAAGLGPTGGVAAPPSSAPRWRAPAGPGPTPPPSPGPGPAALRPGSSAERPRLAGTPGFLRSMAVPRLEEIARRLRMARHEASVEDRLEATPPVLRFSLLPWRGPWTEELSPPRGVLVLAIENEGEERVVVRIWLDAEANEPTEETRLPPIRVGAAWLELLVVDFVERLLERA